MKQSDSSSIMMRTLTLESLFTDAPVRKNTHGSFIRITNKSFWVQMLSGQRQRLPAEMKSKMLKV